MPIMQKQYYYRWERSSGMVAAHGRSGRLGLEGDYNAIMGTEETW